MIFKLQVSLSSSDGKNHMLVYNKDKTIRYQSIATQDVLKTMNNRPKVYFEGDIVNKKIVISKELTDQNW